MHGKDEMNHSGGSSPKSAVSAESAMTVGSRLRGWTGMNKIVPEEGMSEDIPEEGLRERIEEIEVEREMVREVLEEDKELEDIKVVEKARGVTTTSKKMSVEVRRKEGVTLQVVLRSPWSGKVCCMKVIEGVGLCVLRDTGYVMIHYLRAGLKEYYRLLDVISLKTSQVIASVHLETPEDLGPSDVASSSKLRLAPFWQWRGFHAARKDEVCEAGHILGLVMNEA